MDYVTNPTEKTGGQATFVVVRVYERERVKRNLRQASPGQQVENECLGRVHQRRTCP